MTKDIYEDVIESIRRDLDEHAAGLTEEVNRVIEEWETRGHHDDIRKYTTEWYSLGSCFENINITAD